MFKISIIGSGDIAQEIFREMKALSSEIDIRLTFICHTKAATHKLSGMVMDSLHDERKLQVSISTNKSCLSNTDVCILCAGVSVTRDPKTNVSSINNRESVFERNLPIVTEYTKSISEFCPNALMILVTNPVSRLLQHILSTYSGLRKVVGCGVTNDTLRVRNELRRNGDNNYMNAYIIGEHDIFRQSLVYFSDNVMEHKTVLDRRHLSAEKIKEIKQKHNSDLSGGILPSIDETLPPMYHSYFKHRLAHFLYKTHISTAECITEIIRSYIFEDRIVSVETVDASGTCIVGIPVRFREKELKRLSLPAEIEQLLNIYKEPYRINRDDNKV